MCGAGINHGDPPHLTLPLEWLSTFAATLDAALLLEPSTGFCARLTLDGRRHILIGADLGVNSSASRRVADDKGFAEFFLRSAGLRTIATCCVAQISEIDPARPWRRPADLRYPVILKPLRGSAGEGVYRVDAADWLEQALRLLRKLHDRVLLQPLVELPEYRMVVFKRRCVYAYRREALRITGDGKRTIRQLIEEVNDNRREVMRISAIDSRIEFHVRQRLETRPGRPWHELLDEILPAGCSIRPFANANLKCGGTWTDCTDELDPRLAEVTGRAADALGLTLAGVDLFAADHRNYDTGYQIIEVNADPGFEYFRTRPDRFDRLMREIVEHLRTV